MSKNKLLAQAKAELGDAAPDLTKPQNGGGGDYTPPPEGPARARLNGYIEVGVHSTKNVHGLKTKPRAQLIFELSGPKHQPKVIAEGDNKGQKIPHRITVKEIVGRHMKNGYIKLFNQLNYNGKAKSYLDLLQDIGWRVQVSHYKFKGADGTERVIAQVKKDGAYQFAAPEFQDPETSELRKISVDPVVGEMRLFLWDIPTIEQWDSIFVKGDRNPWQTLIRQAEDFEGSPAQLMLLENGRDADAVPLGKNESAGDVEDGEQKATEAEPEGSSLAEEDPDVQAVKKPAPAKSPAKAPAKAQAPRKPAVKAKVAEDTSDPLAGL